MKISAFSKSQSQQVVELVTRVFAESEGEEEGELIGGLVSDLIKTADSGEVLGFTAVINDEIAGSIFFSRLTLPVEKMAFLLSPVAIATEQQGKGIGQDLIRYGIERLKSESADLIFTYGNPDYYSKVGFRQISEDIVKAPFELTQPEGWLAQSLKGNVIDAMHGPSRCVEALSRQEYW